MLRDPSGVGVGWAGGWEDGFGGRGVKEYGTRARPLLPGVLSKHTCPFPPLPDGVMVTGLFEGLEETRQGKGP